MPHLYLKPSKLKIEKYQQGGEVDTTGYFKKSSYLLEKYKNLNFVQRADTINSSSKLHIGDKTHYMAYDPSKNGKEARVYPTVIQKPGNNYLTQLDGDPAWDYADSTKEYIPVGTDNNFAEYFSSVGYKQKFPKQDYREAMQEYVNRINPNIYKTATPLIPTGIGATYLNNK